VGTVTGVATAGVSTAGVSTAGAVMGVAVMEKEAAELIVCVSENGRNGMSYSKCLLSNLKNGFNFIQIAVPKGRQSV